jgi:hypothetical protein
VVAASDELPSGCFDAPVPPLPPHAASSDAINVITETNAIHDILFFILSAPLKY